MDRVIKAKQTRRKAQQKAVEQAQQKDAALEFGDAWATVTYTFGQGYTIGELHDSGDLAKKVAQEKSEYFLDLSHYVAGTPFTVVRAVPVDKAPAAPKYKRGESYYATLRADYRAVFLFATQEEALIAAQVTADGQPEQALTVIGGPVTLPVRDDV